MASDGDKKIAVDHVNVRMSISLLLVKLVISDLFTAFLLIVLYFVFFIPYFSGSIQTNVVQEGLVILIILSVLETCLTVFVIMQWLYEYYEITAYAVIHKRGVFFKRMDRYALHNVKQVVITQRVFGRIFNFGTLILFDWRLQECAILYSVHNPNRYLRLIETLLPDVDEHHNVFGTPHRDDSGDAEEE